MASLHCGAGQAAGAGRARKGGGGGELCRRQRGGVPVSSRPRGRAEGSREVERLLFGRPHLLRIRRGRVKGEDVYEEFGSEEEAGRFWDTHDSSEYLDQMEPVEADVRLV